MANGKVSVNIAAVLAGAPVSKSDTRGREQIEYIDIDRMDSDPNNFYELSGIEKLAANIELVGLQQPIRVRVNPDDTDRVIIVAGHRRHAALQLLVKEGKAQFQAVACIRELTEGSTALRELRLIYANSDTRKMTDAEVSKQAERVEMLLYQLQEEGVEFPGRMRNHVAAACKVSKTKLARLKVIRDGLISEYAALFEDDKLPEQSAYALAHFPAEFQQRLIKAVPKVPTGSTLENLLKKYESGWRWEPSFSCPDGTPCKRGDTFLRHDADCLSFEQCGGNKCCLNCSLATATCHACERACNKAKAAKKDSRDEKAAAEIQRRQKEQEKLKKEIQASAKRLLAAADAAGVPDETELKPSQYGYSNMTVATLRAYARGEFGDKYFYSDDLAPGRLGHVAELAKMFHCSADYLLGLTDDLTPPTVRSELAPETPPALYSEPAGGDAGGDTKIPVLPVSGGEPSDDPATASWKPGTPTVPGYYFVITGPLNGGAKFYYWTGSRWEHPCTPLEVNINATAWCPAPPIPAAYAWNRGG